MSQPSLFDFSNGARFTATICNDRAITSIQDGGDFEVALGNGGNDYLDGGSGRDYIVGGAKGEQAGVSDNDIILGGADNDILHGGAGDDLIYADDKVRSDRRDSSETGDWVNGGLGDDQIHGSRQRDFLLGGAGTDLIYGHEGDDVILGDGSIESMTRLINLPNGGQNVLREHTLQAA